MRHIAHPLALAAITLGCWSASANAAPPSRPFFATLLTHEVLSVDPSRCPAPPYLAGNTVGGGVATRLGVVNMSSSDCPVPGDASQLPATLSFSDGKFTLMGANGDQLFAVYSGGLVRGAVPGFYKLSGDYTVTGGTGRFVGATGSGVLKGTANLITGRALYTAKGTIQYAPGRQPVGDDD